MSPNRISPATARHRGGSHLRRATGALALTLALTGCGLRWETPLPEEPSADAIEQSRQSAAVSTATLAATLDALPAPAEGEDEVAAVLDRARDQVAAQEEALGGLWVAWPEGAPEGVAASGPPATAPPAEPDAADVLNQLERSSAQARRDAVRTPDDDVAALLASMSIARAHLAADLGAVLDVEVERPAGTPMSIEALLRRGVDGPTVAVLDQARHAWETRAARADGDRREAATRRAEHYQSLVDAALAAGARDSRLPTYAEGDPGETDRTAELVAVLDAERDVLEHWLFSTSLANEEMREVLLAAAEDSAAWLRRLGGQVGDLPGLA